MKLVVTLLLLLPVLFPVNSLANHSSFSTDLPFFKMAEDKILKNHKKSICGNSDDREPSNFSPFARTMKSAEAKGGCTGTLISPSCMLSAGHCIDHFNIIQFNVPTSNSDGTPNSPGPEDQYSLSKVYDYRDNGPGNDWAVFSLKPNPITGARPGAKQGYLEFTFEVPPSSSYLQITGYGIDRQRPHRNVSQQTHTGPLTSISASTAVLNHNVDTEPGNSGSTVLNRETLEIIGIHSHGGCSGWGGSNRGTALAHNRLLQQAIQKCLTQEQELY